MNIEEELTNCEIYSKQIKQYDPDPFYVNYFFTKYINSINNIINGIFEEANMDFGLLPIAGLAIIGIIYSKKIAKNSTVNLKHLAAFIQLREPRVFKKLPD